MPVISVDYEDLTALIGKSVAKAELVKKCTEMGIGVEGIEGNLIELEILPNRPDLYSVEGIARALQGFLRLKAGIPKYTAQDSDVMITIDPSVKDVRPYVVCAIVKNIRMNDFLIKSLMDIQEKLHLTVGRKRKKVSIGVHDFGKVKTPFIYKAVEPKSVKFVPLAKDLPMDLEEILKLHEKGIEYAYILKDKKKYPLICDANNEVLSFPPIINGRLTTVTEDTTHLFLDVTGTDFNAVSNVLSILCTALSDRGGELYSVKVKSEKETLIMPDLGLKEKKLDLVYANQLLGLNLSHHEIKNLLERMRFGVTIKNNEILVSIPSYRSDILHPADIVEEIAIAYEYQKFEPELPRAMTVGKSFLLEDFCNLIREIILSYGFTEVNTFTLSNEETQLTKMNLQDSITRIKNPIVEGHTCLKISLIPPLLETLSANKHYELPQKIFEIGDVILNNKNHRKVAGLIISSKAGFTEIKSLVDGILRDFGVGYSISEKTHPSFIEGRCAAIIHKNKEIGLFGELHPIVVTNFELSNPVTGFEFDVEKLMQKSEVS